MDLRPIILQRLDARLSATSPAPLALGLSGGGDSLALLLIARDWAAAHGRALLVLTVDHGLNPASAGWTDACRRTAARLGLPFRALAWEGDKPSTGLPAAARAARHALLADAARAAGARVILLGHTADDLAESRAMRAGGSSLPDVREWSPSPAWPQGRGLFLLRPMLGVGRQALRDWLAARGETWIDDPANQDPRFARARARSAALPPPRDEPPDADRSPVEPTEQPSPSPAGDEGYLVLPRSSTAAVVAAACLCAAGTTRPPRGERLARLLARLASGEAFAATLAGARIEAAGDGVLFTRDVGERSRGGLAPLSLPAGEAVVWDGRFELLADRPGLTVEALGGHASRLSRAERLRLKVILPAARPGLPVILGAGPPTCPILAGAGPVSVRALGLTRFEAATGCVEREPAA